MRIDRDTNPTLYQARLKNIARSILADKCMFFLGAGASLGPGPSLPTAAKTLAGDGERVSVELHLFHYSGAAQSSRTAEGTTTPADRAENSLPTVANLSREMAHECQLDWYDYIPLSTIAFYYESYFTRDDLNNSLVTRLRRPEIEPSPTIRKLMKVIRF